MLLVAGGLLGLWFAYQGLYARLFGSYPSLVGVELWAQLAGGLGWPLSGFAWPLVVLGCSWWGALLGIWIRNKLGWPVALILAVLSLFHLWQGTVLAAIALALLLLPSVRAWANAA